MHKVLYNNTIKSEISEDDKIKAAQPQGDNLIMHRLTELLA